MFVSYKEPPKKDLQGTSSGVDGGGLRRKLKQQRRKGRGPKDKNNKIKNSQWSSSSGISNREKVRTRDQTEDNKMVPSEDSFNSSAAEQELEQKRQLQRNGGLQEERNRLLSQRRRKEKLRRKQEFLYFPPSDITSVNGDDNDFRFQEITEQKGSSTATAANESTKCKIIPNLREPNSHTHNVPFFCFLFRYLHSAAAHSSSEDSVAGDLSCLLTGDFKRVPPPPVANTRITYKRYHLGCN